MRSAPMFVGFLLITALSLPAGAQQDRRWWLAFDMGEGQVKLSSDQQQGSRTATYALGFAGGRRITSQLRAGLHLNGWLLQATNQYNPAVGESVGNFGGVLDAFPLPRKPLFVRGGIGLSMYENNRPEGVNGHGLGWEAGGGYEFRLPGMLSLAPMVECAGGGLGDAYDPVAPITGRRFSVVEFKLAAIYRFGKSYSFAGRAPNP